MGTGDRDGWLPVSVSGYMLPLIAAHEVSASRSVGPEGELMRVRTVALNLIAAGGR